MKMKNFFDENQISWTKIKNLICENEKFIDENEKFH